MIGEAKFDGDLPINDIAFFSLWRLGFYDTSHDYLFGISSSPSSFSEVETKHENLFLFNNVSFKKKGKKRLL
jgi:hypothetical protein